MNIPKMKKVEYLHMFQRSFKNNTSFIVGVMQFDIDLFLREEFEYVLTRNQDGLFLYNYDQVVGVPNQECTSVGEYLKSPCWHVLNQLGENCWMTVRFIKLFSNNNSNVYMCFGLSKGRLLFESEKFDSFHILENGILKEIKENIDTFGETSSGILRKPIWKVPDLIEPISIESTTSTYLENCALAKNIYCSMLESNIFTVENYKKILSKLNMKPDFVSCHFLDDEIYGNMVFALYKENGNFKAERFKTKSEYEHSEKQMLHLLKNIKLRNLY